MGEADSADDRLDEPLLHHDISPVKGFWQNADLVAPPFRQTSIKFLSSLMPWTSRRLERPGQMP
jgi:hypothetical protein